MTKRINIITQHYFPEMASVGQIFQEMAEFYIKENLDVTIITGIPFYHDFEQKVSKEETINGVKVKRLWNTQFSKNSIFGKLINLLTFQLNLTIYLLKNCNKEDIVIISTDPPFGVVLSTFIKKLKRYKVFFIIQDMYPDVLYASSILSKKSLIYKFLKRIIKNALNKVDKVITIGINMKKNLMKEYNLKDVDIIPNWAIGDVSRFTGENPLRQKLNVSDKFIIQYSGNLGRAHEIDTILGAMDKLKHNTGIIFLFIGSGVNYKELKTRCEMKKLSNVLFLDYFPKEELKYSLNLADLSLVIFNQIYAPCLLPSKYYGILASGKPVLLITKGENDFTIDINKYDIGYVVKNGDKEGLVSTIISAYNHKEKLAVKSNNAFNLHEKKYNKRESLNKYLELIKSM